MISCKTEINEIIIENEFKILKEKIDYNKNELV
jgi:hypothetical protein